jgi:hypothetical protein
VRYIQFPWRLLGLGALCVALLASATVSWTRLPRFPAWILTILLVALMAYGSLGGLDPRQSKLWYVFPSAGIDQQDAFSRGHVGFGLYDDYRPVSMQRAPVDLSQPRAAGEAVAPPMAAVPSIEVLSESPNWLRLHIHTGAPFDLSLPRIAFPTWQVSVAGRPVPAGPRGPFGFVTAHLPPGDYEAVARFVDTPLRLAANILTGLCLIVLIAGLAVRPSTRWALALATGFLALVLVLAVTTQGLGHDARRPVAYPANFQDEVRLSGYDLDRTTVYAGETLNLRLYWLVQKTPASDYKVFIHLIKPDDSGAVAQSDSMPNLGYSPTSRWEPGQLLVDQQQVKLDAKVPPGTYLLLMGLYRTDTLQNLRVSDAPRVLPGDRVVLTQIEVRGR